MTFSALGAEGGGTWGNHGFPHDHVGPEVLEVLGVAARVVEPGRDDDELRVLGLVVPD